MWFVKSWVEAAQFSFDVQAVIVMRFMTQGAAAAGMVMEKFQAVGAAQTAVAFALAKGKSLEAAAELATVPVKRSVRANRLRLVRD
jgi:hypothetical protein